MFEVVNFNNVLDEQMGLYAQWQQQYGDTNVQLGARIKKVDANADDVSTSMATMSMTSMPHDGMGMENEMDMTNSVNTPTMAELAIDLRDRFNRAERSKSDTLFDVALNVESQISNEVSFNLGLGVKTRAPSYQERYLWTPMESTGGLADGNTYIGNINLEAETAYQIDLGLYYQSKSFDISPHIFYQNINDYIQGTPLGMMDMSAKMMAGMMTGDDNPLKFTNVDAKLFGIDLNWSYQLTDSFSMSGVASYVKGERRDISDNLYRVAPLNTQIHITYVGNDWIFNSSLIAAAMQENVSQTNNEKPTSGYGVMNIDLQYYASPKVIIRAGVDNVFDKEYQRHLGGYNRVKGSDIGLMDRLPAQGVSAWVEMSYSF